MHPLGRDPEILAGGGQHLEAAGQQIVGVAQVVECRVAVRARRARARAPRPAAACRAASAESPARSATSAASCSRCASVGSARNSGTRPSRNNCRRAMSARMQLAEFGHHERRRRIDRRGGVEHHVGALEVAGEGQQLGQQHARAEIGRRLAHRGLAPPPPRRRACRRETDAAGRLVSASLDGDPRCVRDCVARPAAEIGDELERGGDVVELVVRLQLHDAAEAARPARPLAHLTLPATSGKRARTVAGAVEVGVDVSASASDCS